MENIYLLIFFKVHPLLWVIKILTIGEEILAKFEIDTAASEWEQYNSLLPLNTFNEFGPQIIYDIAVRKDDRVNSLKEWIWIYSQKRRS